MHDAKMIHDCLDCEGCLYEEWCKENDEKLHSGLLEDDDE